MELSFLSVVLLMAFLALSISIVNLINLHSVHKRLMDVEGPNSVRQDVFRQVVADSGTYYWLGFTPSWKADDRNHLIRVESKRPGVEVRARTSFPDLSRKTENSMKAESVLLFAERTSSSRRAIACR